MTTNSRFDVKKRGILAQLGVPEDEYHDLSPKGSVDEPIRSLIGDINRLDGLVTTSSCSGRLSVFLEGRKKYIDASGLDQEGAASRAGPGGKGGGAWLYISHAPVEISLEEPNTKCMSLFGLQRVKGGDNTVSFVKRSHIHLKFEPMVHFFGRIRRLSLTTYRFYTS
jgi:tRNA wybutosine-synthesizing protein 3